VSARVLVVEDDALSLKLMLDVLEASGFETCAVGDGTLALPTAIEFGADVVVMDIGLPGIDGVEATRLLKQDPRTQSIPVVAVSAFAMPADELRMREAGCDAFLTKPLKLQDLVATVRRLAGSSAASNLQG
jgi:two-component system cell cycle response regulator DivK